MVEGLMTFGKLETGQRTLDFECCEDVVAEAFNGRWWPRLLTDVSRCRACAMVTCI